MLDRTPSPIEEALRTLDSYLDNLAHDETSYSDIMSATMVKKKLDKLAAQIGFTPKQAAAYENASNRYRILAKQTHDPLQKEPQPKESSPSLGFAPEPNFSFVVGKKYTVEIGTMHYTGICAEATAERVTFKECTEKATTVFNITTKCRLEQNIGKLEIAIGEIDKFWAAER